MVAHHHCNRAIHGRRDWRLRCGLHIEAAANGMVLASQDIVPFLGGLRGDGRPLNGKTFPLDDCAGSLFCKCTSSFGVCRLVNSSYIRTGNALSSRRWL